MNRVLAMPRRSVLALCAMLVLVAVTAVAEPGLALSLTPALLLLALLTGGFRPGEALIERVRARLAPPRQPRASSATRPRLALVVRPAGRLLASALAMRPPPSSLAVTS